MDSAVFATVKMTFLAVRDLPKANQPAAMARIDDPVVRAEVASLLGHDIESALLRPRPVPIEHGPPAFEGVVLDDRVEVHTLVAEGGFGWVFRGLTLADGAPVAIKLFKPITDPTLAGDVADAFVREGEILKALGARIAHVVNYLDVGNWETADGHIAPYIVMEWLDGPTLQAWLKTRHPEGADLDRVVALLSPIAQALMAAHEAGVAHRDVKPENVLCTGDLDRPMLKLIDFGAAKRAADRARGFESTGGALGMVTFRYSAPEQISKTYGSTGPWSDVYALALVVIEAVAGRHPFAELDVMRTMDAALDPRVRPTLHAMGVPTSPAVRAVFKRAVALHPKARYANVEAFWTALVDALGEASNPPRSRWSRLWRILGQ